MIQKKCKNETALPQTKVSLLHVCPVGRTSMTLSDRGNDVRDALLPYLSLLQQLYQHRNATHPQTKS